MYNLCLNVQFNLRQYFSLWAPEQLCTNTAVKTGLILTTNLEHPAIVQDT